MSVPSVPPSRVLGRPSGLCERGQPQMLMGPHGPLSDEPGHRVTELQGHTGWHRGAVAAAVLLTVTPCRTQASNFSRSIRNPDVLSSQKCLLKEERF